MRKLFTLCLLVFSLSASAQWQQTGSKVRYVNGLGIPTRDTAAGVAADSSQILIRPADSALYVKYKRTWLRVGGGGGSIAGSGTTNYIPKFTSSSAIGNSQIFDNGTNVGIGTTSLFAKLQVNSSGAGFTDAFIIENTNAPAANLGTALTFAGTGTASQSVIRSAWNGAASTDAYMAFLTRGSNSVTERMRITAAGDVGIGTTSPATKFVVSNAGASGLEINPTGGVGSGVLLQAYNRSTSAYMAQSYYALGHTFNVGTAAATRALDISSAGNTLVGTAVDNGTDRLQVSGSVRTSSNLQVDGLVGINITPASYSLNINSGGTNVTRIATQQTNNINDYEHSSSTSFGRIGNASGFNASGATGDMSVGSYNNLSFYTRSGSFIERARITATSGNVLISTTTDNNTDKLQVNGSIQGTGFNQAYTARTTTYTAATTDYFIDCTSGTFTVNLFTAVGNTGRILIIKNSGTGTITVDPNGTQTIDGATTQTLSTQWSRVHIISDGANWKIISN